MFHTINTAIAGLADDAVRFMDKTPTIWLLAIALGCWLLASKQEGQTRGALLALVGHVPFLVFLHLIGHDRWADGLAMLWLWLGLIGLVVKAVLVAVLATVPTRSVRYR